jgi:hypothetical protein
MGHEQRVPVAPPQRFEQRRRGLPERAVLVEHGQPVAHDASLRAYPTLRDLPRVQLVQQPLELRKGQPHQTVEKVVQVVARRHLRGAGDEGFVGLAGHGRFGRDKPQRAVGERNR